MADKRLDEEPRRKADTPGGEQPPAEDARVSAEIREMEEADSRRRDEARRVAEANRAVDEAAAAERARPVVPDKVRYGVFADHPQKFVVVSEMVGPHRRGDEITYRELMAWHDGDRARPHVGATKANADRLVAAGHIRPLVLLR